jgi:type I restriction enzyme M protein
MAKKTELPVITKEVLLWLSSMNFRPINGEVNCYAKKYGVEVIKVDIDNETITYPEAISVHDKATCNLSKRENLVVLECVNRLLEKGYKSDGIELEKNWKLGHQGKGRLDILVKHEKLPYLMIECKTWGKEYNGEIKKMYTDGGQLISYYPKESGVNVLCLYTSNVNDGKISYLNSIININSDLSKCTSSELFYDKWDKNFETKGIFNDTAQPYKIEFKGLIYSDLYALEDESSNTVFNQFNEILRRNAVSDKSNAFNKIFNLFICKIVDEDAKIDTSDDMDFQWKATDSYEIFFDRLNSLYKQGAKDYINIDVEDLNNTEFDKLLSGSSVNNAKIKNAFTKLRLYKNNEFAFKEVFNEDTFLENALIVKEVVQLLQAFKIKYNQKQQFLGDFFERLLNTGFKQEVGQYFTPLPLARFICKSLPVKTIIDRKNDNKEKYFLPYIIDYASGSGHFITEIMDEINNYIQDISKDKAYIKGGKSAKDEFASFFDNYKWAKEYVYGIEKDYRLAKTTKISTFLNGDGEANIIMGDGLDNFKKSKTYFKKLKEVTSDNGTFDIIVANPPYSIKEFKNTLLAGKETFSLYPYVTDKGGNIECLFVERTKQLLADGGVAGIILPVSFLTSSDSINIKTREFLFKNFNIKACVYLGEKTFMATNVYPIVVFIEKRKLNDSQEIQNIIDNFFTDFKDFTCNGIENAFTKYIKYVYGNFTLKDYKTFVSNNAGVLSEKIQSNDICKEYFDEKLTIEQIISLEKTKMLYFVISYNQKVVIVDSGSGNKELDFLGYEFSGRRGSEGIKLKKNTDGTLKTKLFHNDTLKDVSKVNSYILDSFSGSLTGKIDDNLKDYLEIVDLSELFDFNNYTFDNTIRYGIHKTKFKGVETVKLKHFFEPISGVTYNKNDQLRVVTSKRILTSTHINLETGNYKLEKPIYLREDFLLPDSSQLKKDDLFISTSNSLKHLGKVALIDKDLEYHAGGFCTILRPKEDVDDSNAISVYAKNILQNSLEFRAFINLYKNSRISNIGNDLLNFRIPMPK